MKLTSSSKFQTINGLNAVVTSKLPNETFLGYVTKDNNYIAVNWRDDGSVVGMPNSELAGQDEPMKTLYESLTDTDRCVISFLYQNIAPGGMAVAAIQRYFPAANSALLAHKLMEQTSGDDAFRKIKVSLGSVKS